MYNLELYLVPDPRFNFQKVSNIKTHLDDTITEKLTFRISVKAVKMTRKWRTVNDHSKSILRFAVYRFWVLKLIKPNLGSLNLNSCQLKNGFGTESSIR